MKKISKYIALSIATLLLSTAAYAENNEKINPKEVVTMVKKAIAFYKKEGKDNAFAAFDDVTNKDFHEHNGALYIFVVDTKGVWVAHGFNPRLIGKDLYDLKDPEGTPVTKALIDITNAKGAGWIEYKWPDPATKKLEQKVTYGEKVEGTNLIICSGAYK